MSFTQERFKVVKSAVDRMNVSIVGHVIAIILQGGRTERQQPHCGNAQLLQIVQFLRESTEVPYAIAGKRLGLAPGSIGFIRMRCLQGLRLRLEERGFV